MLDRRGAACSRRTASTRTTSAIAATPTPSSPRCPPGYSGPEKLLLSEGLPCPWGRGFDVRVLTISEFGRRTGLSHKALRLYDVSGLLPPAQVDPANGYRLY